MRRFITLLIIVAVIGGAGYAVYKLLPKKQTVTVNFVSPTKGVTVKFYKSPGGDTPNAQIINDSNLVQEVSSPQTIKLTKGDYVWQATAGDQYTKKDRKIVVDSKPVTVDITLALTDTALGSLLSTESSQIRATLNSALPLLASQYEINTEKMYGDGTWYGALIVPRLTAEQRRTSYFDIFRVVVHKEDGRWKLVSNPPELILTTAKFPQVPKEVLSAINATDAQ